ncbi:hypothetical protein BBJ28_00015920 [Nothophytophthora sp. Chile5]|nr:hypothetical protein BBJ28_00015920 [Nothophytophthora sp. Chile5]
MSLTLWQMVAFAGLSDLVTIFVGAFSENYTKLKELGIGHADGSVVIADNVGSGVEPGMGPMAPGYLEYVRSNAKFTSVFHESFVEYQAELKDGVEVSTYVG